MWAIFSVLREILDRHSPLLSQCVPNKTPCLWYIEETEIAKQRRRALEKIWRKTATSTPLNRSRIGLRPTFGIDFYPGLGWILWYDTRAKLWKFKADVEFCQQNTPSGTRTLTIDHISLKLLANSFVQYFAKKNEIIRSNFPSVPLMVPEIKPKDVNCPLSCFRLPTQDEVKKIIMSSSNGTFQSPLLSISRWKKVCFLQLSKLLMWYRFWKSLL